MKDSALWGCFGLVVFTGILLVLSPILNGLALSILWGWFVVPLFGLPALSIPNAIGLSLVVGFMTHQIIYTEDKRDSTEKLITNALAVFLVPAVPVLIGYIVTLFM